MIELTELTGLSSGSLSKIENGVITPSLNRLKRLATALNVSVATLVSKLEKRNNATFIPAGGGVKMYRHGSNAAHVDEMLGRNLQH